MACNPFCPAAHYETNSKGSCSLKACAARIPDNSKMLPCNTDCVVHNSYCVDDSKTKLFSGMIGVVIVIAVVVFAALALMGIIAIFCVIWRRKRRDTSSSLVSSPSSSSFFSTSTSSSSSSMESGRENEMEGGIVIDDEAPPPSYFISSTSTSIPFASLQQNVTANEETKCVDEEEEEVDVEQ